MAKMKKNSNNTRRSFEGVTPVGTALYPKLSEPDYKFNKEGVYSVKLRLTEEEAEPIIAKIEELVDDEYSDALENAQTKLEKSKIKVLEDMPCKEELDENAEPTGFYILNAKMKASGRSAKTGKEWTRTPAIFDDKGNPIVNAELDIWTGTEMKVAYELVPFNTSLGIGCSCRLKAVQIIKLVSGSIHTDAKSYGFEKEEDGFCCSGVKEEQNNDEESENIVAGRIVDNTDDDEADY